MKKLAGLLVFVAAVAGAFAVSRYFSPRRETVPPPAAVAPAPAVTAEAPPSSRPAPVFFKTRLATLDFGSRKSHVTLALERDRSRPAPERLWVWALFFTPDDGSGRFVCAAESVEVRQPFANGDRTTVTVTASATSCVEPTSPSTTFYAHVNVSADSPEAARLPGASLTYDTTKATPVVVEGSRPKGR